MIFLAWRYRCSSFVIIFRQYQSGVVYCVDRESWTSRHTSALLTQNFPLSGCATSLDHHQEKGPRGPGDRRLFWTSTTPSGCFRANIGSYHWVLSAENTLDLWLWIKRQWLSMGVNTEVQVLENSLTYLKKKTEGLPWWASGWESTY